MGDDDGFVMNLAGLDDGDHDGPSKKGNPRKRTVMKPERKGRHRGWAGKRADMVGKANASTRGAPAGGRGAGGLGVTARLCVPTQIAVDLSRVSRVRSDSVCAGRPAARPAPARRGPCRLRLRGV